MRKLFGTLIMMAGIIIAAYCGLVALGFLGISLIGFIGTSGREGGKEILQYGGIGAVLVLFGLVLCGVGKRLRR